MVAKRENTLRKLPKFAFGDFLVLSISEHFVPGQGKKLSESPDLLPYYTRWLSTVFDMCFLVADLARGSESVLPLALGFLCPWRWETFLSEQMH